MVAASTVDCEALAEAAAAEVGVPAGVLSAIARMESGHAPNGGARRAWPWTINLAGDGSYHETPEDALWRARTAIADGRSNIDLGCMQINYRWHGDAFASLEAIIEPRANTRYAARFLRDLYQRHGSWAEAVAHYHSADPERGAWYLAKVRETMAQVAAGAPSESVASAADNAASEPQANPDQRIDGLLAGAARPLIAATGAAPQATGDAEFTARIARLPEGRMPDLERARARSQPRRR